ncbi:MAG: hypothetical protein MUE44_21595 [Oscillatoriaceae cyanobacterium Prado104]|jgi:hypothetical protein|nr:hypothetical protein [Oscillatoriaceae cyanobacterium Prado104]
MIEIDDKDKIRIAKFGANKLFEEDYNKRQKMNARQLIDLFDRVWSNGLERMVKTAEVIPSEEATRRLKNIYHDFVDAAQEHRSFYHLKAEFIAQLQPSKNNQYKLTQLWLVNSSDTHPKTLYVTFCSVEERELFTALAQSLGTNDEELGLRLIRNFMDLHPGYTYKDADDKSAG